MSSFYVPYLGRKPKVLDINGHRVLIVGSDREDFDSVPCLELGKHKIKEFAVGESEEEQLLLASEMAKKAKADIVLSPLDVDVDCAIEKLKAQLPWVN